MDPATASYRSCRASAVLWLLVVVIGAMGWQWRPQSPLAVGRAGDPTVLIATIALSLLLCGFVVAQGMVHQRGIVCWLRTGAIDPPIEAPDWAGFARSCSLIGLFVVLLTCVQISVGLSADPDWRRWTAVFLAVLCGGCGVALLVLSGRRWSIDAAEVGMALICLCLCCAGQSLLPTEPAALARRSPLIFNALIVTLGVMSWFWCWLGCVWVQQLDGGTAWTTGGRMIVPAWRMSFYAGLLALASAWVMTIWPRLSGVPTMDHSLGRIASGVAAHLLILWAFLWCGRRTRRSGFVGLAVLAVASLLAFVYVRTVPLVTMVS
ncbi:MAG: hypothetical protein IID40_12730 [Planctomycetes bacterium]|nr:hypothetical protein [Planctomycetota bacterium]